MVTKKSIIKNIFFLAVFLAVGLAVLNFVLAQSCPSNTQVGETTATLVGEVTDDGGDPNLEVWFQYGKTTSYGYETSHQSKYGTGLFCTTIYNLEPATTYHYRAVAKNSAGTSYGEDKTFTTLSPQIVTVDLKANSSDGPITLNYRDYVVLSWNSSNAVSCWASGDWSGGKYTSGSESIKLNSVKTYTFTLTCQNSSGQEASDSVQVIARPNLPKVITKPAIVTY
ncbi:hypothetical protein HZA26_00105 [Candidatus Nomurabacteria bacterium]|nr:hypothetical protein [Candidatus Nomurabacteria bacterium]